MNASIGPSHWAEIAPAAGGQRQSPIVIRASEAQFSQTLRDRPLVISYNPVNVNKLINNGQSVQVCVDANDSSASPCILTQLTRTFSIGSVVRDVYGSGPSMSWAGLGWIGFSSEIF